MAWDSIVSFLEEFNNEKVKNLLKKKSKENKRRIRNLEAYIELEKLILFLRIIEDVQFSKTRILN